MYVYIHMYTHKTYIVYILTNCTKSCISPFNFNWHAQQLLFSQISNFLSLFFKQCIRDKVLMGHPCIQCHMFFTEQGFWVSPDLQNQNFWKNYNHLCLKLPQTIKKHYFVFSLNRYKLLLWGKCSISLIHVIHTMHWPNRDLKNLQNIQILMVWMWNIPYKLSWQDKKQNPSEILSLTLNWSK